MTDWWKPKGWTDERWEQAMLGAIALSNGTTLNALKLRYPPEDYDYDVSDDGLVHITKKGS